MHFAESSRLYFKKLEPDMKDEIYRQFSDPEMCRYFSEPPCTPEEALEIISHYDCPSGSGYLRYSMIEKETDTFIGTIGYHYWDKEKRQVELGYDVWREYWGKGYASEAIPVMLDLCFRTLGVEKIYVLVHPENVASIRAVKKYGFKECSFCRKVEEEPQICLELFKNHWENRASEKVFSYEIKKDNSVFIYWYDKKIKELSGDLSRKFINKISGVTEEEAQHIMAKTTANIKRKRDAETNTIVVRGAHYTRKK